MNFCMRPTLSIPSYDDQHRMSDTCTDPFFLSSVPAILTVSAVLMAVDAAMHMARWRSQDRVTNHTITMSSPASPLTHFVIKAEQILIDFQELEKTLGEECRGRDLETASIKSHSPPLITGPLQGKSPRQDRRNDQTSAAFAAFCERLLLTNQIWKQEKKTKALRSSLEAKTKARSDTAFRAFCENLLLQNRIWKLEREVTALSEERAKMKRSRVAAITRAAKQMVLDVRKESLVEEFVKDLIEELKESRQAVENQKKEHEREIAEIIGDWVKDYRKLAREVDGLKLAQEARLVEQEVANEMEQSLYENLRAEKRKAECLEETVSAMAKSTIPLNDDTLVGDSIHIPESYDDDRTDVEMDRLSELSSSSTCVSVAHTSPRRKRRATHGGRPTSNPVSSHDTSVLFQTTNSPSPAKRDRQFPKPSAFDSVMGQPLMVRQRTESSMSLKQASTLRHSGSLSSLRVTGNSGMPLKKKAPWRV